MMASVHFQGCCWKLIMREFRNTFNLLITEALLEQTYTEPLHFNKLNMRILSKKNLNITYVTPDEPVLSFYWKQ